MGQVLLTSWNTSFSTILNSFGSRYPEPSSSYESKILYDIEIISALLTISYNLLQILQPTLTPNLMKIKRISMSIAGMSLQHQTVSLPHALHFQIFLSAFAEGVYGRILNAFVFLPRSVENPQSAGSGVFADLFPKLHPILSIAPLLDQQLIVCNQQMDVPSTVFDEFKLVLQLLRVTRVARLEVMPVQPFKASQQIEVFAEISLEFVAACLEEMADQGKQLERSPHGFAVVAELTQSGHDFVEQFGVLLRVQ